MPVAMLNVQGQAMISCGAANIGNAAVKTVASRIFAIFPELLTVAAIP
jgi:hypothetical protein